MKQLWQNSQLIADIESKKLTGLLNIYQKDEHLKINVVEGDWILENATHKSYMDKILEEWENLELKFVEQPTKPAWHIPYNFVAPLWKVAERHYEKYGQDVFDYYVKDNYIASTQAKLYWISLANGSSFLEASLPIVFFKNGDRTMQDFLQTYRHKSEKTLRQILFQLLITGYLKVLERHSYDYYSPSKSIQETFQQMSEARNSLLKLLSKLQNKQ